MKVGCREHVSSARPELNVGPGEPTFMHIEEHWRNVLVYWLDHWNYRLAEMREHTATLNFVLLNPCGHPGRSASML